VQQKLLLGLCKCWHAAQAGRRAAHAQGPGDRAGVQRRPRSARQWRGGWHRAAALDFVWVSSMREAAINRHGVSASSVHSSVRAV